MKLRTGDTVLVISGKDKGKTGTVMKVMPEEQRVVIAGINMRTRHIKKTPQEPGRRFKFEASLHASNVMYLDPKTKKPSRLGFQIDEKGAKKRVSKVSGEVAAKVAAPTRKEPKDVKEQKDEKEMKSKKMVEQKDASSAPKQAPVETKKPERQPFWKRMKFGAAALEDAEVSEDSHMKEDHSIPKEQKHVRKGARGS
jgi:large subunit ribosomal protein L24